MGRILLVSAMALAMFTSPACVTKKPPSPVKPPVMSPPKQSEIVPSRIGVSAPPVEKLEPFEEKLDPALRQLRRLHLAGQASEAPAFAQKNGIPADQGKYRVQVVAVNTAAVSALKEVVEKLGAKVVVGLDNVVFVDLPGEAIDPLVRHSSVLSLSVPGVVVQPIQAQPPK